jgi:hypothetical protein
VGGGIRRYTIRSFIKEAWSTGVCRRIGFIPKNLELGLSRLFFVSDIPESNWKKEDRSKITPRIFGYTTIAGLIVPRSRFKEIVEEHPHWKDRIIQSFPSISTSQGGYEDLDLNGTYLIDDTTLYKLKPNVADPNRCLKIINPPITFPQQYIFKGVRLVNGDAILKKLDPSKWFPQKYKKRLKMEEVAVRLVKEGIVDRQQLLNKMMELNLSKSKHPLEVYKDLLRGLVRKGILEKIERIEYRLGGGGLGSS